MPDEQETIKKAYAEISTASKFYNEKGPGHPKILIMSGLPMSGKSHLSNLINEKMRREVCVVRADRFRLIVARHMGRNEPIYDASEHSLVFKVGELLISGAVKNGWSVIADATNLKDQFRQWAVRPALDGGHPVLVIFLETSVESAIERNRDKDRDGSAATPAVYALLNYEREPVEMCTTPYLTINSETDMKPWADILAKWLSHEIDTIEGIFVPSVSTI